MKRHVVKIRGCAQYCPVPLHGAEMSDTTRLREVEQ
jgi:hypothetical protein